MKSKGFTLIELLVVVAIIGVLASIVLSSLGDAKERAARARLLGTLREFQVAVEMYYNDNGVYPNHATDEHYMWTTNPTGYPTNVRNWDEFRAKMQPYYDMDAFEEAFSSVGLFHEILFDVNATLSRCPDRLLTPYGQTYNLFFSINANIHDPIDEYYTYSAGNWHRHCMSQR
jgi:prepilin-type N-terminal cleavage/methylation domain-containing protein